MITDNWHGLLLRSRIQPPNITSNELRDLKQLKEDRDIIVLPADKGGAVVVLDRIEYDRKIRALLDDSTTYRTIQKDPTLPLNGK